jgi:mono/diheme cytochrome c family protein
MRNVRGLLAIATIALGWLFAATSGRGLEAAGPRRVSVDTPATAPAQTRALLNQYCVTCHNEKLRTGGLALDKMDVANVAERADIWEKVVQKLRAGVMPPSGRPRPDKATNDALAAWFETELDRASTAKPNPGRPPAFHRLNRTEYHNAIRDLLALDVDVASLLPPDDSSYGFDNIGDVLGVSPSLLEGYLEAAGKISQDAIGDPTVGQETEMYHVAPDLTQDYRLEDLPFGTRGGTLIRHYFPVDGEYVIAVRLLRNFIGGIMGLAEQHQLELTLDGQRIQVFTVGGNPPRTGEGEDVNKAAESSSKKSGIAEDARLKVRVPVKAGPRTIGVTFLQRSSAEGEDLRLPYLRSFAVLSDFANGQPHVGNVAITGPFGAAVREGTPSRQQVFACRPTERAQEAACARRIFLALARRAYRRPVTETDLQPLLSFYEAGRSSAGFDAGIQAGLRRLLVSPEFLVRIERDPARVAPGAIYRVSDLELASRLSFFLWSSIPDDELLRAAELGRLRDRAVLLHQVRRMLADGRSRALVSSFAGQWLYLRNIPAARPDTQLFPDFDENLRLAFRRETELLFETVIREDRSALDLLAARYTFVNERLARHYGIANVYGDQFRRVELSEDDPRGGLLGQGSILTVTSYPDRTSPVLRGKWILENVLGAPPPPPPPDIPQLQERNADGKVLSMRERMVQHRASPVCASCHARMDPLGLALEPFDAVGRWRDRSEANAPIDASGTLPDGTRFNGPKELRHVLLSNPDRFVNTLSEKLFTYALGRGLQYYDAQAVRVIARDAARNDYRFSTFILGIVTSTPFQMRRSQS